MKKGGLSCLVFSAIHFICIVKVTGKLFPLNGSCNQIYHRGQALGIVPPDGVYNIMVNGSTFPVYCDMTTDGGGWTLLVYGTTINRTTNLWTESNIKRRNENNVDGSVEFSILYRADSIKDQGSGNTFQYRIDGWKGDRNNGGIWEAPKSYSFTSNTTSQTNVTLVMKYGTWTSAEDLGSSLSISNRMPRLHPTPALLTTWNGIGQPWWGTLIQRTYDQFGVGAWIHAEFSLTQLRYWMREKTFGIALKQDFEKITDKFSIRAKDQYIPNHRIWFMEGISKIKCGAKCSTDPRCLSFNFQKSTDNPRVGTCELNSVQAGTFPTRLAPRTGCTLYEMNID